MTANTLDTVDPNNEDVTPKKRPELSPEPADKRPSSYGIIAAIVVIAILAGISIWLFYHPDSTATLRDIFIIWLGLGIFIIILLIIVLIIIITYLVLKVNDLVQLVDREIKPILYTIQDTLNNVQGTTTFISDHAAKPVISTVSTVAAVRSIVSTLFRRK